MQGKTLPPISRTATLLIHHSYYNTVGSKEGWAPSTFVSSRTNRNKDAAKTTQQRAEDFMDEEDIADQEDARRVETAEAFAGLGSTQNDSIRQGGLVDLFRADGETMGTKLLKKMGWKEGQGVGPKVRRKARLDGVEKAGDTTEMHLFAPENTQMIGFARKNDHKGLGFAGEEKLGLASGANQEMQKSDEEGEDRGALSLFKKPKKKKAIRGGIGIGILNDTGSDDEDPYEVGPRISYNKVIGGDKKKKKKPSNGALNPALKAGPVFISKKAALARAAIGLRKCHDGRLPLDGFILSMIDEFSTVLWSSELYGPPVIPEGWKSAKQPRPGSQAAYLSTADAAKASKLDPKSRAAILGEASLPGKSVFDFLTPAARERMAAVSGKSNLPAALGEIPDGYAITPAEQQKERLAQIPKVDIAVAEAALSRGASGFMPYGEDESKRQRYRKYLEYQAGISQVVPEKTMMVSKEDWLKELREFANCALIFKPMSGMMATRFTSSTTTSQSISGTPDSGTSLLSKPTPKVEDPAEQAAKLGMYGPMTRSSKDWLPTRLLCKRFNVKPPANVQPGATEQGEESGMAKSAAPDLVGKGEIDRTMREANWGAMGEQRFTEKSSEDDAGNAGVEATSEVPSREETVVDAERNEALEGKRAGDAVFQSIFGDDSDEDD